MIIEYANYKNIEILKTLRMEYLSEDFGLISDEKKILILKQLDEYLLEHLDKDFYAVIAFDQNYNPISTAFLVIYNKPANPSFINGKTAEFFNVYTRLQYRNRGIATKLLSILIQKSKMLNASYIKLSATNTAKSIYEKLGFKELDSKHTEMKLELN